MDLGLKDRVYLVTGGSRGLGFATARELVAEGAKVALTGRRKEWAEMAAADLGATEYVIGLAADNADPTAAERLLAQTRAAFGAVHGVLVSVGGPSAGSVLETPDEAWRTYFESVFLGAVRLARTAAGVLGEGGVIGFVLSGSVRAPIPSLAISNGLRPGLAMVAKTLADELGPRQIRVLGLLPARVRTSRLRELDSLKGDPDQVMERTIEGLPLWRYGEPEEFARVAAFALSPAASYLTGLVIPVDGGALRAL